MGRYLHLHSDLSSSAEAQEGLRTLHDYPRHKSFGSVRMSLSFLQHNDLAVARLLLLMAFFDRKEIHWNILSASISNDLPRFRALWLRMLLDDELKFNEAVRVLRRQSLLDAGSIEPFKFSMHSLVQSQCIDMASTFDRREMLHMAAILIASQTPLASAPDQWKRRLQLLPHAERLVKQLQKIRTDILEDCSESYIATIYSRFALLFQITRRPSEAEDAWMECLNRRERHFGEESIATTDALFNAGNFFAKNAHRDKKNARLAENLYMRAVEGYTRFVGENANCTLDT